jgi:tRNA threonylcarbamoyl adenosine modification protein YeaZ
VTVIAIDTASRQSAWVVLTDEAGTVLGRRQVAGGQLDRQLPGALAEMLGDAIAPIEAVVVMTGPGSYTGVRGGMAAALGLASSRGVPLHGIGNLEAIAVAASVDVAEGEAFDVLADAGRGGVYVARFERRARRAIPVSALERREAGCIEAGRARFATTRIAGLEVSRIDSVVVLSAAVPAALGTPPLEPEGLSATHVHVR